VIHLREGDTFELGPMAIRLQGIAAPEWNAPSGDEATDAVKALVLGREPQCELIGNGTYDRCVAVCYHDSADVEAIMVGNGFARDCPRFSGRRHAGAERHTAREGATITRTYRLPGYCRRW
jgi:micrococcal nuclease